MYKWDLGFIFAVSFWSFYYDSLRRMKIIIKFAGSKATNRCALVIKSINGKYWGGAAPSLVWSWMTNYDQEMPEQCQCHNVIISCQILWILWPNMGSTVELILVIPVSDMPVLHGCSGILDFSTHVRGARSSNCYKEDFLPFCFHKNMVWGCFQNNFQ